MDEPTSSIRINAFPASLSKFATRKERFGTFDCDRCVDFFEFIRAIDTLNQGPQQWAYHISPALDLQNAGRRCPHYLLVAYSNPDSSGIPNHLCFCVPLFFRRPSDPSKPSIVACFEVSALTPLSSGLYWDNGRLVGDFLGDFDLFYEPLVKLFWNRNSRGTLDSCRSAPLGKPQTDLLTIEGISYKKSIAALLWRWIFAPEELARANDPYSLQAD